MSVAKASAKPAPDPTELLYSRPGFLFRRANQIAVASFMEEMGDLKLTTTQYAALLIVQMKQPIDQVGLARSLRLDRSTTGLAVANLEKRGVITREPDATDRRRRILKLNARGDALLAEAHERGETARVKAMAVFSGEEERQLIQSLQKFVQAWDDKLAVDWPLED
jgi:DNA-binding MarR family transcriptional regulator